MSIDWSQNHYDCLTDHNSSPNWNRFWLSHYLLSHLCPMQNQIHNTFWLSHHHNYTTVMIVSLLSYLNPIYNIFWLSHHYNCLRSIIVSLFPHQNQICNTFWPSHHCIMIVSLTQPNSTPNYNGFWLAQHYDCLTLTLCHTFWLSQHCNCPTIMIVSRLPYQNQICHTF